MKRAWVLALLFVLSFGLTQAEDDANCPASSAADQGFKAIENFHKVIGPVWHTSWQQKDYSALFAAGPVFDSVFVPVSKFPAVFKTEVRARTFEQHRAEFRRLIKQYSEACAQKDSAQVYELLPKLHDAFEQTASALLPVDYPELDGLAVTLDLIRTKHLPEKNEAGIEGSTETLVAKMDGLTEETIPPDLSEKKDAIMDEFAAMKKVVANIKECADNKDFDDLKMQAGILNEMIKHFKERFL